MTQISNKYNLEERTAKFGENIIEFCIRAKQDVINKPIINQLIRSEKLEDLRKLWGECQELTMIFQKINNSMKGKN